MAILEVLSDNRNLVVPYASSIAINRGDLLYYDTTNKVVKPLTSWTTGASETVDQSSIAPIFAGVAFDTQLSTETNQMRVIVTDGVFDIDCVSNTYYPGDLVGVTWNGGTGLASQYVTKISGSSTVNSYLAIGEVVNPYGTSYQNFAGGTGLVATTRVRCRLVSRLFNAHWLLRNGLGALQGIGSKAMPGTANYQVLLTDPPILTIVPTAARTVTLPTEATANGLQFTIVNNNSSGYSLTLAGTTNTLIGNSTVGQGKTAVVVCDGTYWYSYVSA
jgi:hypothetical protein